MNQPHVAFDYSLIDGETSQSPDESRLETIAKVTQFIRERVIASTRGRLPNADTIAVRLIVLTELMQPTGRSLRSYAQEMGCSRAWLSKVAISFSDSIGMRAGWQRINAREAYAERARGVHRGTWVAKSEGGKWERRKLREASRDGAVSKKLSGDAGAPRSGSLPRRALCR